MALEPSAFITQMLGVELVLVASLPSSALREANAILLPSGDQACPSLLAPLAVSFVNGVTPEPSGFITQMFKVPFVLLASVPSRARFDLNAILLPSGDQTGDTPVKKSTFTAESLVKGPAFEPSGFITQMLRTPLVSRALLPLIARLESN